jgi:opacity protein-like surface antigen
MNPDEIKNLIQVLMTVAGGIIVSSSNGKISQADWASLTGALLMLVGPAWSIVEHWNMKKVSETAKVVGGALLFALALGLASPPVQAADVGVPVLKAPALKQSTCTVTDCSGLFVGFNVAGVGSNLDILGSGINNSVFAGGGMIGGNAGYQLWNGQFFAAAEFSVDARFNTNMAGAPNDKFLALGLVKAGAALGNLFGAGTPGTTTSPTPSQAPINLAIIPGTAMLSPYALLGGAWSQRGTGWATGAGSEFLLAKGWNLDVKYIHINYAGGQTTAIPGAVVNQSGAENIVMAGFLRKF